MCAFLGPCSCYIPGLGGSIVLHTWGRQQLILVAVCWRSSKSFFICLPCCPGWWWQLLSLVKWSSWCFCKHGQVISCCVVVFLRLLFWRYWLDSWSPLCHKIGNCGKDLDLCCFFWGWDVQESEVVYGFSSSVSLSCLSAAQMELLDDCSQYK